MQFAARSDFGEEASGYSVVLREARQRGGLLDLTVSNPTRCGFSFPENLLDSLSDAGALRYDPDPLGMRGAREAVARLYAEGHKAAVHPDRILLTASTSETYSYLLRLFCEPGEAILVPSPSYPLFDLLARLHDVEVITYPLVYHDGWQIDPASLNAAVTDRVRSIVAIHPNNPTGHYCSEADRAALHQCAARHGLPLIVDEVFLDYAVEGGGAESFAGGPATPSALTFVLNGLSKLLCLPQMKLAWTIVTGPPEDVEEAMQRLGVIADTFLSAGTPPQLALPAWLPARGSIQRQVRGRVHANLAWLDTALTGSVVSRLRVEGGWTVVLRVPANDLDTDVAARLLQQHGVAVHPGSFYGFPARGWLVVSLLTLSDAFQAGIARIINAF